MSTKSYLVTTALPYANGPLHLGHILENIWADMWVRHLRQQQNEVYFFCADDTHGTAIMLEAQKRGIPPEIMIEQVQKEHQKEFLAFHIQHDHYGSTHSSTNRMLCEQSYLKIQNKNLLFEKQSQQWFCPHDVMFLPDRYVKGQCPVCGALNQYGDSCDVCGSTYESIELKNPFCAICGNKPELKTSRNIAFHIDAGRNLIKDWLPHATDEATLSKIRPWLENPLKAWEITRQAPYFGFTVPDRPELYFYVWWDAPLGYMSTSWEYWQTTTSHEPPHHWQKFWQIANDQYEIHHIIGKDIIYFHTIFWPIFLHFADFRLPKQIWVHGFVTINGQKMSKSKGTWVRAGEFIQHVPADYLRFYFGLKLKASHDDIDLDLEDFVAQINGIWIGKIVNLVSRTYGLLKNFGNHTLSLNGDALESVKKFWQPVEQNIVTSWNRLNFQAGMEVLRNQVDELNRMLEQKSPWRTIKTEPESTHVFLSEMFHHAIRLMFWLGPITPATTEKFFNLVQIQKPQTLNQLDKLAKISLKLLPYEPLGHRLNAQELKEKLFKKV